MNGVGLEIAALIIFSANKCRGAARAETMIKTFGHHSTTATLGLLLPEIKALNTLETSLMILILQVIHKKCR